MCSPYEKLMFVSNIIGGIGNWTNRGCTTIVDSVSGIIQCTCNHLTNFAALVVSMHPVFPVPIK